MSRLLIPLPAAYMPRDLSAVSMDSVLSGAGSSGGSSFSQSPYRDALSVLRLLAEVHDASNTIPWM